MNWKRALIPALFVIPFLFVISLQFGSNPREVPFVLAGKPAPEFKLQTLDGQTFTHENLKGKATVVNFWSTWCVPCKVEHDVLQFGSKRFASDVQFVGVIYQDTAEAAREYLKTKANFYPQIIDDDAMLAISYGVSGVPESFFVDPDGIVRYKQVGPVTPDVLASQIGDLMTRRGRAVQ